jgi:hypothetical protein
MKTESQSESQSESLKTIEEGIRQVEQRAFLEGIQEGIYVGKLRTVKNIFNKKLNLDIKLISEITDFSKEAIKSIKESLLS